MDVNVNENAINQVIQELTAEKLRLTAENEELRSKLEEKKEGKSERTGSFVRIIEENSARRK